MKKLRVEEVRKKSREIGFSEPVADFSILQELEGNGLCRFTAPVSGLLSASAEFDHVRVEGDVGTRVLLQCARCLAEFETDISARYTVYYSRAREGEFSDPEIELAENDLLSAYFTGDEIDVTPELAEQLLMEIPIRPLCDERCKGLCPHCGTDLNQQSCGCPASGPFGAFAQLNDFTVPTKGE